MTSVEKAKTILEKHGCSLVEQLTENTILWKNKKGIVRCDDAITLCLMSEKIWPFWEEN